MGSLPLSKAGVGSAVNDTAREVGGALGVAVLGSILSSSYRSALDLDLSAAPPEAAAAIREGVGSALAAAQQAPDGVAPQTWTPPSTPSPTPWPRCSGSPPPWSW